MGTYHNRSRPQWSLRGNCICIICRWMYERFFWNRIIVKPTSMFSAQYGLPETNDLFVIIGGERSYSSDGELGYGCHDYSVVCSILIYLGWKENKCIEPVRISFLRRSPPVDNKKMTNIHVWLAEFNWYSLRLMLDISNRVAEYSGMLTSVRRTPFI